MHVEFTRVEPIAADCRILLLLQVNMPKDKEHVQGESRAL